MQPSDLGNFVQLIVALDPWLDHVVIIGGWAHRLYRLHPRAQELDYAPLMTLDTDVALPATLPAEGQSLRERLLASGFQEEFLGDHRPPVTHYRLGQEAAGFYAEFLTPLVGGPISRRGERKVTALIAGVATQRLRHLDMLLTDPWSIDLALTLVTAGEPRRIRIPNPASFLAQKALVHARRTRGGRAKDVLYMHDTLEVFGARLAELRDEWTNTTAPGLHARTTGSVRKAARQLFGATSDTIREAALLAVGRNLSPEALRETCGRGFNEIFG